MLTELFRTLVVNVRARWHEHHARRVSDPHILDVGVWAASRNADIAETIYHVSNLPGPSPRPRAGDRRVSPVRVRQGCVESFVHQTRYSSQ